MQLQYKKLLENICDWSWATDVEGVFTYCSSNVYNYLGFKEDEIVGKTYFDFMHIEEAKRVNRLMNIYILEKKSYLEFEKTYIHKDGREVYLSTSAIPIFDTKGVLLGFQGIEKDITKKKQLQMQAKETEERLNLALIGSNNGIWDWNIIDDSVYLSPRWKEMLGYTDNEIPNEMIEWTKRIHPDDIDETLATLQEHINSHTKYYEGVHRLKHKDGHWVWILDRAKALYDCNNKAIRMIGTHTDITQQKAQSLKAVHQQQIIEQIHDSVIATDLDGVITSWNHGAEILLGYSSSEVIGKHISLLHLKDDIELLNKILALLMQNGESYVTVRVVTKSKNILFVDLSLSMLKDENSNPIGLIGYAKDITEKKQAEDTLERQARMVQMGEMLSMIAHQWRQPLNAISLTAANLKLKFDFNGFDFSEPKAVKQCALELSKKLAAIEGYVQTLSTTVDDFRKFHQTDKEYHSLTLEDVISKSLNIITMSLKEDNIEIIKEYDSNEKINIHVNEIIQVILNIFKNTQDNFQEKRVKHPCIKIIIKNKTVSICDNGGGIPKDIIDKIFMPYFSTKTDKNGTGLGLYMSRTIVEEHHKGKLLVKNIKNGVCFTIDFTNSSLKDNTYKK